jgi:uncharacterized protein (TIGR03000 family)
MSASPLFAQGAGRGGSGTYIGGYSGGNSRGGNPGVYIGGAPGGRPDGSGYYIGGYPSSFSGYNYPSNPPGYLPPSGYKGYTTPLEPTYPETPKGSTEAARQEARALAPRAALVHVQLPPAAELWFDGHKSNQTGPQREFTTPLLTAGQKYSYTVRARWVSDGRPVEETRKVTFTPGQRVDLTFPKQAEP